MTRFGRHNQLILMYQVLSVVAIAVCLVTLPVCDARAYSPFPPGDDLRTITERRSTVTVETQPGVRILHASNPAEGPCEVCGPSQHLPSDPTTLPDTFAERVALIEALPFVATAPGTMSPLPPAADPLSADHAPASPPPRS